MWRAPLAGLASLAMVATMGVAASTANAAEPTVTVDGASVGTVATGYTLADAIAKGTVTLPTASGSYFVGWYDVNNTSAPYDFNAPVTKDLKLKSVVKDSTSKITVNFSGSTGFELAGEGSVSTIYVDKDASTEIPATRVPSVPVADGTVTSWDLKDGAKTVSVSGADLAAKGYSFTTTPTAPVDVTAHVIPGAKVTFQDAAGIHGDIVGAASDRGTNEYNYEAVVADNAAVVKAPTFITNGTDSSKVYKQWKNDRTGKVFAFGTALTSADVRDGDTFTLDTSATAVTNQYKVSFDLNGGNGEIADQTVNENDKATKPATDPTRDGYVFQGWKAVSGASNNVEGFYDFDSQVKSDIVLQAQWAKVADIKVTFSAGNYVGAGDDTTITVAGDAFVDESKAPKFTREGYTYDSWALDINGDGNPDSTDPFDFDTTLAAKVNHGKNFALVPLWTRVDENMAKQALLYVQTGIQQASVLGSDAQVQTEGQDTPSDTTDDKYAPVNDSAYFTKGSFDEFAKTYKAQYQKYVSAAYKDGSTVKNEVPASTSAEIVNALKDAWKGLRFSSANADTVLDGKNNGGTAKVVYRLNRLAGLHHLLTADENEVWSLTNKYIGQGGWTKDETTFRVVNNPKTKWVKGIENVAPALVNEVPRLYNAQLQEHMYTSDQNEISVLTAGDWTKDSNLASFYVPALYTTKTKVVRLYNPGTHLHLYTSDTNEVNVLTTKGGWTLDGDAASFYAL